MRIIWSPLALERATEIVEYIAQDNISAAKKWINTVFEKVGQLELFPNSGRIVPEIEHEKFRELLYVNYRIIYQVAEKQVNILTIRHGKQVLPLEEIIA